MIRKLCLATIALVGIVSWGGCRTPYGGGGSCGCKGGCNGNSCPVGGSTYAPATSGGGTVPSAPAQDSFGSGGSGTYGGGGGSGTR